MRAGRVLGARMPARAGRSLRAVPPTYACPRWPGAAPPPPRGEGTYIRSARPRAPHASPPWLAACARMIILITLTMRDRRSHPPSLVGPLLTSVGRFIFFFFRPYRPSVFPPPTYVLRRRTNGVDSLRRPRRRRTRCGDAALDHVPPTFLLLTARAPTHAESRVGHVTSADHGFRRRALLVVTIRAVPCLHSLE